MGLLFRVAAVAVPFLTIPKGSAFAGWNCSVPKYYWIPFPMCCSGSAHPKCSKGFVAAGAADFDFDCN